MGLNLGVNLCLNLCAISVGFLATPFPKRCVLAQPFFKRLYMDYIKPSLIEPGVRYFLNGTLKECRKFKDNYISVLFNISMVILLVVVIGGWLLYRYKGKPTPAELEVKERKKQEYIISKLQQLAFEKKRNTPNTTMITGLPTF